MKMNINNKGSALKRRSDRLEHAYDSCLSYMDDTPKLKFKWNTYVNLLRVLYKKYIRLIKAFNKYNTRGGLEDHICNVINKVIKTVVYYRKITKKQKHKGYYIKLIGPRKSIRESQKGITGE